MSAALAQDVRPASSLGEQILLAQAWVDMTRDMAARSVVSGRCTPDAAARSVHVAEDVVAHPSTGPATGRAVTPTPRS